MLIDQKDFNAAEGAQEGSFSVLLYRLQPFNFMEDPKTKTISFRAPPLKEEYGQKGASLLIRDAEGAVSEQENVFEYTNKVPSDLRHRPTPFWLCALRLCNCALPLAGLSRAICSAPEITCGGPVTIADPVQR